MRRSQTDLENASYLLGQLLESEVEYSELGLIYSYKVLVHKLEEIISQYEIQMEEWEE